MFRYEVKPNGNNLKSKAMECQLPSDFFRGRHGVMWEKTEQWFLTSLWKTDKSDMKIHQGPTTNKILLYNWRHIDNQSKEVLDSSRLLMYSKDSYIFIYYSGVYS